MSKVAVPLAAAAALAGFVVAAPPATAQSAAQRVAEITVFGNDPVAVARRWAEAGRQ